MKRSAEDLLDKALSMEARDRALIAEGLIASLETEADLDAELAWQEEIQKRALELDSGKLKTISWEQVKNQIRKELSVKH